MQLGAHEAEALDDAFRGKAALRWLEQLKGKKLVQVVGQ
jgi:hypothetical protein